MATATIIDFSTVDRPTLTDPNAQVGIITYQLDDQTVHIVKIASARPTPEAADAAVLADLELKQRYIGRRISH